jgi:aspartyl protease family protein
MAIRYDIEVERTVSVTATPRLTNSRRAIDWRGVRREGRNAGVGLLCLVVAGGAGIGGIHYYLADSENSYGKAPDVEPPERKAKSAPVKKEAGQRLVIKADSGDRCHIDAFANGQKFRFLLDSGAAGVFFTMSDARKLGLDPDKLSYDHTYSQWGGNVKGAKFTLQEFRVGGLVLHDVDAVIDQTDWETPLLGAPILKALSFQVRDGECVLSLPARQSEKSDPAALEFKNTPKAKPPARREATAQERDYAGYCALVLREPQYNWGMVPGCREQFPDLARRALRTIEAEARKVYDAGGALADCKAVEGTGAPCRPFWPVRSQRQ